MDKRGENFIKIFDKNLAAILIDGGFSYMKEKINGNLDVFVFENNEEINVFLEEITENESCFEKEIEITFDDTLRF